MRKFQTTFIPNWKDWRKFCFALLKSNIINDFENFNSDNPILIIFQYQFSFSVGQLSNYN
jgi:hypothetical protein